LNDELKYYMFDIIMYDIDYESRFNILKNAYLQGTKEIPFQKLQLLNYSVIHDVNMVKIYHDEYVGKYGFEGIMLRKLGLIPSEIERKNFLEREVQRKDLTKTALKKFQTELNQLQKGIEETWHKPGRNQNLLKVKAFIDEEGIVQDIISGEGREDELALIVLKDIRGNILTIRPRGSFELRKHWLRNKNKYIAKKFSFRYFELSDDKVPRFPIGIDFRDYE